jgi:hypothetical protein
VLIVGHKSHIFPLSIPWFGDRLTAHSMAGLVRGIHGLGGATSLH